ncbi:MULTISPECIES: hypothetical protein [unclassified Brevundimonas]|nr:MULTISPECIES: hypothetical protein [unclassified Brevundimonas]
MTVKHGSEGQWSRLPEDADPGDQSPWQTRAALALGDKPYRMFEV